MCINYREERESFLPLSLLAGGRREEKRDFLSFFVRPLTRLSSSLSFRIMYRIYRSVVIFNTYYIIICTQGPPRRRRRDGHVRLRQLSRTRVEFNSNVVVGKSGMRVCLTSDSFVCVWMGRGGVSFPSCQLLRAATACR